MKDLIKWDSNVKRLSPGFVGRCLKGVMPFFGITPLIYTHFDPSNQPSWSRSSFPKQAYSTGRSSFARAFRKVKKKAVAVKATARVSVTGSAR